MLTWIILKVIEFPIVIIAQIVDQFPVFTPNHGYEFGSGNDGINGVLPLFSKNIFTAAILGFFIQGRH